jgi:hypothetical protein
MHQTPATAGTHPSAIFVWISPATKLSAKFLSFDDKLSPSPQHRFAAEK